MSPQTGAPKTCGEQDAPQQNPVTQRPRGYKLADEEMERIAQKLEAGDVLDPIALDDPVGQSVEKVIMRVGVTVVIVLVVGLLLAQVMCKNIQVMGVPDFSEGVTVQSVEDALIHGILWGGDIVRFPEPIGAELSDDGDTVMVTVAVDSAKSLEQLVAIAQGQATALAMNIFADADVSTVIYVVHSTVDPQTGAFDAKSSHVDDAVTVTWRRSETSDTFVCSIAGFEPAVSTSKAQMKAQ